MESNTEIEVSYFSPIIYKVEIEYKCFDEILHLFVDEILQRVACSKVEPTIVSYITRVIEPVGWKAVWRATQESLGIELENDFVVEVIDVSLVKLEADVIVKSVLVPNASDFDMAIIQGRFKVSNFCTVPLVELYPISEDDEEEMFAKTAVAIEHVRLFYKHLYRPWDNEEEDAFYSEKILQPRLQLYFDIKNKALPEIMISKINAILKEGWVVMNSLKALYSTMSDSEVELSEDDVIETLELRKKLEELKRKMDILENPIIRTFVMKKYAPRKSPLKQPHDQGPLTFLVASQFTFAMIAELKLPLTTPLKFDNCPEHALKSCSDGDTVIIFPGNYRCDTLGWLDSDVTVKGFGPSGCVRIEATGSSEVFLNCDSHSVHLENLHLISTRGIVSTVVVHHGSVVMKDCLIDSDGSEVGVTLLGGGILTMQDSEVCNAKEDGIQLRSSSILNLRSSKIVSCGRHGIEIDVDEDIALPVPATEISIADSYIVSNDSHGIHVNSVPTKQIETDGDGESFHTLDLFPWLKYTIENTVMSHNKHSGIGTAVTCKLVRNSSCSQLQKEECGEPMCFGSPDVY